MDDQNDRTIDGEEEPVLREETSEVEQTAMSSSTRRGTSRLAKDSVVRHRLTLVCAECKRLKLRCDRRAPCESCTKRNTVNLCVYSQAAIERVDLTSVNNKTSVLDERLSELEDVVKKMTSNGGDSSDRSSAASSSGRSSVNKKVVVDESGASLSIRFDELTTLCLKCLKVSNSCDDVELEFKGLTHSSTSSGDYEFMISHLPLFNRSPDNASEGSSSTRSSRRVPGLTSALMQKLPAKPTLDAVFEQLRDCQKAGRFPCLHVKSLQEKTERMIWWSEHGLDVVNRSDNGKGKATDEAPPNLSVFSLACAALAIGARYIPSATDDTLTDASSPLGNSRAISRRNGDRTASGASDDLPTTLFRLSRLALTLAQEEEAKQCLSCDYVEALLLQCHYLLISPAPVNTNSGILNGRSKRSRTTQHAHDCGVTVGIATELSSRVGDLVYSACKIGLDMDPDDFPNNLAAFQKEQRRRLWWEIVRVEKVVSDMSGQNSLLADGTHTTRFPVVADEERFEINSPIVPLAADEEPTAIGFLVAKNRYVALERRVLSQFQPGETDKAEAQRLAKEVAEWYNNLAASCKLSSQELQDLRAKPATTGQTRRARSAPVGSTDARTVLQKIELAISAYHLMLKLYVPFCMNLESDSPAPVLPGFSSDDQTFSLHAASPALFILELADIGQSSLEVSKMQSLSYPSLTACFHAGVVLASICISGNRTRAPDALDGVRRAIDILRVPSRVADDSSNSAIGILSTMFAEASADEKKGQVVATGNKRKVEDQEIESLDPVHLPFIGASVSVKGTYLPDTRSPAPVLVPESPAREATPRPSVPLREPAAEVIEDTGPLTSRPRRMINARQATQKRTQKRKEVEQTQPSPASREAMGTASPQYTPGSSLSETISGASSHPSPQTPNHTNVLPTSSSFTPDIYLPPAMSTSAPTFSSMQSNPDYPSAVSYNAPYPPVQTMPPVTPQHYFPGPPPYYAQQIQGGHQATFYQVASSSTMPSYYGHEQRQSPMDSLRADNSTSHPEAMQNMMGMRRDSQQGPTVGQYQYHSPVDGAMNVPRDPSALYPPRQPQMGRDPEPFSPYNWSGQ